MDVSFFFRIGLIQLLWELRWKAWIMRVMISPSRSDHWSKFLGRLRPKLSCFHTKRLVHKFALLVDRFLQLDLSELQTFVSVFKHIVLKRQSIITCLSTLKKAHAEETSVSCLVVGTENRNIYVLDPEAFTVLATVKHWSISFLYIFATKFSFKLMLCLTYLLSPQLSIPAVPVFVTVSGLYEVEYQLSVACRDAVIYIFKRGGRTPKYKIVLGSQPCGLVLVDKHIVLGCMDHSLSSYTFKVLVLKLAMYI